MRSSQRRIVQPSRGCRAASRQKLNAPEGMALVPAGFGEFGNRLLVGNFGDCRINAFDLAAGEFIGQLESTDNVPVRIEGLYGFAFGNGFLTRPINTLSFTAGPGDERHRVYGRLEVQSHNHLYRK
ncbi:TIGR03118 family protein [Methylobacter sp. BlB1]|uniref:TIGR03118 family protein n=1 Tax=Methylobacter sp. BlB1 TaxID=2785914 RepID=UPI0018947994|nr:TIGR03118 family protein [Methylobacter sp. BlB1]MBF6647500.1 TIGR03118 family protein [Methylobacter sp. BlB1]